MDPQQTQCLDPDTDGSVGRISTASRRADESVRTLGGADLTTWAGPAAESYRDALDDASTAVRSAGLLLDAAAASAIDFQAAVVTARREAAHSLAVAGGYA